MEQREKLIKARAARLARDAKKQGITPEQLLKKKRDTYLGVVGGAASLALPFGPLLKGATALFKSIGGAAKVSKVGTTVAKGAKKVSDTAKKLKKSKTPTKTTAKPKADAKKSGESLGTKVKKIVVATTGKGGTKGRRSGMAIRDKKTGRLSGISKKTQRQGKAIRDTAKVGGPAVVALGITSQIMKKKDGSAQAKGNKDMKGGRRDPKKTFGMGMVDDFSKSKVRRKDNMEGGTAPIADKKKSAPKTKDIPKKKFKAITAGSNVGFGPKGNMFPKDAEDRKRLMKKYGGTGSAAAKAAAQGKQGSMKGVGRA